MSLHDSTISFNIRESRLPSWDQERYDHIWQKAEARRVHNKRSNPATIQKRETIKGTEFDTFNAQATVRSRSINSGKQGQRNKRWRNAKRARDKPQFEREVYWGNEGWKKSIYAAWNEELSRLKILDRELYDSLRAPMEKRMGSFFRCGAKVKVRECDGCGHKRDGSGHFTRTHNCKTKVCGTCTWVKSRDNGEWAEAAYDQVESVEGYSWQYAVIAIQYDPTCQSEDLEVPALRRRALQARRIAQAVGHELKAPGSGLQWTIECGIQGHVHINLLYYGPKIDKAMVASVARDEAGDRGIRVHSSGAALAKPEPFHKRKKAKKKKGDKEGVKRVAQYIVKGMDRGSSHFDESFLSNQTRNKGMDSNLAVRWELATYKLRLSEKSGAFRGLKGPSEKELDGKDDENVSCPCCGLVGEWRDRLVDSVEWIIDCSGRGSPGLSRSEEALPLEKLDPAY